MAIDWIAIIKAVPWTEVAKKAPEVAEGAKKLWNNIASKSTKSSVEIEVQPTTSASGDYEIKLLKAKLGAIEVANLELHNQLLASADLIKALADQNTQLINAVELNRKRIVWLTTLTSIISIIAIFSFVATFTH